MRGGDGSRDCFARAAASAHQTGMTARREIARHRRLRMPHHEPAVQPGWVEALDLLLSSSPSTSSSVSDSTRSAVRCLGAVPKGGLPCWVRHGRRARLRRRRESTCSPKDTYGLGVSASAEPIANAMMLWAVCSASCLVSPAVWQTARRCWSWRCLAGPSSGRTVMAVRSQGCRTHIERRLSAMARTAARQGRSSRQSGACPHTLSTASRSSSCLLLMCQYSAAPVMPRRLPTLRMVRFSMPPSSRRTTAAWTICS